MHTKKQKHSGAHVPRCRYHLRKYQGADIILGSTKVQISSEEVPRCRYHLRKYQGADIILGRSTCQVFKCFSPTVLRGLCE